MRNATIADLPHMRAVLNDSFENDPHVNWFIGSPAHPERARRRRAALMEVLCRHSLSCGLAFVSDDGQAAALWQHSERRPQGMAFLMAEIRYAGRCGLAASLRSLALERESGRLRPSQPHFFLWAIGVSPGSRGRGLFGDLVRPILEDASAKGQEVWLETTVQRNVEIYTHYGFSIAQRYRFRDTPEIILMRRNP